MANELAWCFRIRPTFHCATTPTFPAFYRKGLEDLPGIWKRTLYLPKVDPTCNSWSCECGQQSHQCDSIYLRLHVYGTIPISFGNGPRENGQHSLYFPPK